MAPACSDWRYDCGMVRFWMLLLAAADELSDVNALHEIEINNFACKEHFNCLMDNALRVLWCTFLSKLYESSIDSYSAAIWIILLCGLFRRYAILRSVGF